MKRMFRFAGIAAVVAMGFTAASQDAVMLKYGFTPGKSYHQEVELVQNVVQTVGGQEVQVKGEVKSSGILSVESVAGDGQATLGMDILEVSIHSQAMGMDTTLHIREIPDAFRIVCTPGGKVVSSVKTDSTEAMAIINQIDPGKFKSLPARMVQVGETWKETQVEKKEASAGTPFGTDMTFEMEYTLAGTEVVEGNQLYKVTNRGTIAVTGKGTQMGMELFLEGGGKLEGYFLFDPRSSMVVYSDDLTELELSVAVSGPQNMTIPMVQSSKVITRYKEQ